MTRFRFRSEEVEAMHFDGTPEAAQRISLWAQAREPRIVVRLRIEYGGWQDQSGHLELEIRDHDEQVSAGDWLILSGECGIAPVAVMTDKEFQRCFVSTVPEASLSA